MQPMSSLKTNSHNPQLGDTTPPYLLVVLEYGGLRVITSILMFVHILVSYTLNQQVLARAIHLRWDTKLANTIKPSEPNFWKGQIQWIIITTGTMLICWLLSNLIVRRLTRSKVGIRIACCSDQVG